MKNITENHIRGAKNLLINCADLKPGEKLLIVSKKVIWVGTTVTALNLLPQRQKKWV